MQWLWGSSRRRHCGAFVRAAIDYSMNRRTAYEKELRIVELLLKYGADVDQAAERDDPRYSMLALRIIIH